MRLSATLLNSIAASYRLRSRVRQCSRGARLIGGATARSQNLRSMRLFERTRGGCGSRHAASVDDPLTHSQYALQPVVDRTSLFPYWATGLTRLLLEGRRGIPN